MIILSVSYIFLAAKVEVNQSDDLPFYLCNVDSVAPTKKPII